MLEGVSRTRFLLLAGMAAAVLAAAVALAMGTVPIDPGPTGPPASVAGDRPFLQRLPRTPRLAKGSAAMVGRSIVPYRGGANLTTSDTWGIPVVTARASDRPRRVSLFGWAPDARRTPVSFRIPDAARPSAGSDHHLTVIDGSRQLDLWVAVRQPDGSWKAGGWAIMDRGADVAGRAAATASGFSLTAGLVRPQEIAAGRIDHALLLTTPYVRDRHVAPAVSGDGHQRDPQALPMGSRLQLDPSAGISHLPRTQRIVAQALKDYGAFVGDSSGSLAIRAEAGVAPAARATGSRDRWAAAGAADPSLRAIPWARLRVVAPPRR
jgi:hypothetical protein